MSLFGNVWTPLLKSNVSLGKAKEDKARKVTDVKYHDKKPVLNFNFRYRSKGDFAHDLRSSFL